METQQINPISLIKILGIGSINFAVLSLGFQFGHQAGFWHSLVVMMLILPIIVLLQLLVVVTASHKKQNSRVLCAIALGPSGTLLSSIAIVLTTLLWFGFNLVLIQKNLCLLSGRNLASPWLMLMESAVIFLIFCMGIANISNIIFIQSIILLALCVKIGYAHPETSVVLPSFGGYPAYGSLAANLLPLLLPAIADLPTWYCRVKSPKQALLTHLFIVGFFTPISLILGCSLGSHTTYPTFLEAVSSDTYGFLANLIFISSATLGNSTALYLLSQILHQEKHTNRSALIFTLCGYLLALLPWWKNIETTIQITGLASSLLTVIIILICINNFLQRNWLLPSGPAVLIIYILSITHGLNAPFLYQGMLANPVLTALSTMCGLILLHQIAKQL